MKTSLAFFLGFFGVCLLAPAAEPSGFDADVRVVVLGDSRSSGENASGFNNDVLTSLLKQIREVRPRAVFFTGDLVLGLEKEEDEDHEEATRAPAPATDIYSNHWSKEGFEYNSVAFQKQLDAVSHDLDRFMGDDIPFHPVIGNHEAVGPDAVEIFRDHFDIDHVAPIDPAHLAYTVAVGRNLFIIMATDYYDTEEKRLKEHNLGGGVLDWLEKELAEEGPKYERIFVLGHEPAFTLMDATKQAKGLDRHPKERDRFWALLKQHHVTAYLCAHQHLFDSSRQRGLWQIISGGAGAPLDKDFKDAAYYHYLILDLPKDKTRPVQVTVVDDKGKTRKVFKLSTDGTPRRTPSKQ